MTNYQLAYQAIEQHVAATRNHDAGGRWRTLVPETHWGATWPAWSADATAIVNNFNVLIGTPAIDVGGNAKRNLMSKRLIEFQRYLALKADERTLSSRIRGFES